MRQTVFAASVLFAVALFVGCNAVKGAGQDLQEASDNTREALSGADE